MRENRLFAYVKTKTQISFAVTAKLISAFVLATRILQFLYFLNPKFQASSHPLWLYSLVCVGPGWKPQRPGFSQRGSHRHVNVMKCKPSKLTTAPGQHFYGMKSSIFASNNPVWVQKLLLFFICIVFVRLYQSTTMSRQVGQLPNLTNPGKASWRRFTST